MAGILWAGQAPGGAGAVRADPAGTRARAGSASRVVETSPSGNGVFVPSEQDRSRRRALFIVFLVVFIDLLGFGIVLPVLPRFGDKFLAQVVPGGKEAALTGV